MISTGGSDKVRILTLAVSIPWSHHRCPIPIPEWKWLTIIAYRINLVIIGITVAWRKWWVSGNRLLVEWMSRWYPY